MTLRRCDHCTVGTAVVQLKRRNKRGEKFFCSRCEGDTR